MGGSSRYCWRICAITAGSRSSPAITSAGSPGSNCCSEKIRIDTKNSVGISCTRRRARKVSMAEALPRRVGKGALFAPCPPRFCAADGGHATGRIGVRSLCPPYGVGVRSLQLQPDHAYQAVRHLLVALELGRVRDQELAM